MRAQAKIPAEFFAGRKCNPVVHTVGELAAQLARLPENLRVGTTGISMVVFTADVPTLRHLDFEDANDNR